VRYLWFALALLLTVMAVGSIMDGFIHWAGYFRFMLDIYHTWLREPLSWAVHLVWPSGSQKIEGWAFDVSVISVTFFGGVNVLARADRAAVRAHKSAGLLDQDTARSLNASLAFEWVGQAIFIVLLVFLLAVLNWELCYFGSLC
jgi:hypothetical protein